MIFVRKQWSANFAFLAHYHFEKNCHFFFRKFQICFPGKAYELSVRNPVTYHTIRPKKYSHLEGFLSDVLTLANNIKKYSADQRVLETGELLKMKVSSLLRQIAPSTLHYWMSITMKPVSPLQSQTKLKRVIKPKSCDSDEDTENDSKKVKVEC